MKNASALIFDCDGVLADSEQFSIDAWFELLKEYGIQTTLEEINTFTGKTTLEVIKYFEKKFGMKLPENFDFLKEKKYMELSKNKVKAFEKVEEFLNILLRNNVKIAVASSGDFEKIHFTLKETNLINFFDVICSSQEVKNGKPAPDLFLLAASKLNVTPENCIVVEDSIFGIQGATSAKMKAFGFTSSYSESELKTSGAEFVFNHFSELIEYFDFK
jgi:HAD superfamily hydrolase (TIGR01509 family)